MYSSDKLDALRAIFGRRVSSLCPMNCVSKAGNEMLYLCAHHPSVLYDISKISSVLAILTKFGAHPRELFRRFKSLSFVPRKAELDIDVNLLFFRFRHSKWQYLLIFGCAKYYPSTREGRV